MDSTHFLISGTFTEPPADSIFSFANLEQDSTEIVYFVFVEPFPNSLLYPNFIKSKVVSFNFFKSEILIAFNFG